MQAMKNYFDALNANGFVIIPEIYRASEISAIGELIDSAHDGEILTGERRFLNRTPHVLDLLLNDNLRTLLKAVAPDFFVIKSIYFDKSPQANWFVSWHQDKIIFVKNKIEIPGFRNWTQRENEYGVQPTAEILGNIVSARIHLDTADSTNGALKVIPHSHSESSSRNVSFSDNDAVVCEVPAGGVMLMKPLLFHASSRSASAQPRRVIHLEFCSIELPEGLEWSQRLQIEYPD